jgi:hypothetical protein
VGLIKVDNQVYKFLGKDEPTIENGKMMQANQLSVNMSATQTTYQFDCGALSLNVAFTSPLIISHINILSRPVSYISMKTKSKDGKKHVVQIYVGTSSAIASNKGTEPMIASGYTTQNLNILKLGTVEQPILQKSGDDLRIDWGYAYIAANKYHSKQSIQPINEASQDFISNSSGMNEIKAIKQQGGRIIWVQRGELPRWYDNAIAANAGNTDKQDVLKTMGIHASETAWVGTEFDQVIGNNGRIEDLYRQLKNLVQSQQDATEVEIYTPPVDSLDK